MNQNMFLIDFFKIFFFTVKKLFSARRPKLRCYTIK